MCPCPTSARTPANASIVTAPASRTAPVVIAPASLAGTDVGGFVFGAIGEMAPSTFGSCLAPASLTGTDVGGFVFGAMGETAPSTFGSCLAPASLTGTDVGGFVFGAMGETALSAFGNCLEFSTVCKTGKGRGGLCQKNRIPPRRITPTTPPTSHTAKPASIWAWDLGWG